MNNDKKLILAIKKINSAAEFEASDVDNIIWKNGTTPISKSDIEAQYATVEAEEENKTNKKASGKQKLKDLGLDDDEIKELMGA
jgi:predicted ATP-grasp superfamily ATP-dependent carboligase